MYDRGRYADESEGDEHRHEAKEKKSLDAHGANVVLP
jgi:hypothetical protein